jgi:hypothetical protein
MEGVAWSVQQIPTVSFSVFYTGVTTISFKWLLSCTHEAVNPVPDQILLRKSVASGIEPRTLTTRPQRRSVLMYNLLQVNWRFGGTCHPHLQLCFFHASIWFIHRTSRTRCCIPENRTTPPNCRQHYQIRLQKNLHNLDNSHKCSLAFFWFIFCYFYNHFHSRDLFNLVAYYAKSHCHTILIIGVCILQRVYCKWIVFNSLNTILKYWFKFLAFYTTMCFRLTLTTAFALLYMTQQIRWYI